MSGEIVPTDTHIYYSFQSQCRIISCSSFTFVDPVMIPQTIEEGAIAPVIIPQTVGLEEL